MRVWTARPTRGFPSPGGGAAPKYGLAFVDRLLGHWCTCGPGSPARPMGVVYEVSSSTIGPAIGKIRPLLAERSFAVPDHPGLRLRTLEDAFAYAEDENVTLRIDGMETQVRRPRAGRPGRRAFVSDKRKQNTSRRPRTVTGTGAPCGRGQCGRAGCTTRPRCAPRAPPSTSAGTPRSKRRSTTAIGGWPTSSRARARPAEEAEEGR